MFYFHPYLGKCSKLTNIFQMGWFNHQADKVSDQDLDQNGDHLLDFPEYMQMLRAFG